MCQSYNKQYGTNFISLMPTNLYGPNDNFDLESSHVLPALIRKFHEAKMNQSEVVTLWGTGAPKREFLHVDDLADACLFLMKNYNDSEIINVGTGEDISIKDLAQKVIKISHRPLKPSFINYNNSDRVSERDILTRIPSIEKAKIILKFRHQVSLDDGLSRMISFYESKGNEAV